MSLGMMRGIAGGDVLKGGAQEDKGDNARLQYFVGAIAVGDLVRSTLGPKGLDKILQSAPIDDTGSPHGGQCITTNDGATILKNVWIDNPAAKILADLSLQQDKICGDGTTGVVVLASELLKEAETLVNQNIHPQTIIEGYQLALDACIKKLKEISIDVSDSEEDFYTFLHNVAKTTLSSKLLNYEKVHFANIAVEAIKRLEGSLDLELIHIIKKPGASLRESFLEEGFILEKRIGYVQEKRLKNCNVMIANTPMDTDKIKIYGARVTVDSFQGVHELEMAEKEKMKEKCEKIIKHGCNVFINRQLIYNYPEQILKDGGVMTIEHSDFDGMERLAACLDAEIVSTFDSPETCKLGHCDLIEEIMIGEDKVIRFSGCKKKGACTIVLRGGSVHLMEEAERSLHDAIASLSQISYHYHQLVKKTQKNKNEKREEENNDIKSSSTASQIKSSKMALLSSLLDDHDTGVRFVCGGGACEMALAREVEILAQTTQGKKTLAIDSFAKSLRRIPIIIMDNGGLDSAELSTLLRSLHSQNKVTFGVDIDNETCDDMLKKGILESYTCKLSQISKAVEAAQMIVRVDDIIRCAPRERMGM